jgi:hypothetical protein
MLRRNQAIRFIQISQYKALVCNAHFPISALLYQEYVTIYLGH